MTQVWEYIKIALMNIRSNKGRSILTMLGIIIGISSVIMIISIGNGVKSGINGELNSMAGGQIAVYSNDTAENGTEVIFTEGNSRRRIHDTSMGIHQNCIDEYPQ
jgi:putative ABC transport system permease protein